jgi:hypothetical protein
MDLFVSIAGYHNPVAPELPVQLPVMRFLVQGKPFHAGLCQLCQSVDAQSPRVKPSLADRWPFGRTSIASFSSAPVCQVTHIFSHGQVNQMHARGRKL